MIQNTNYSSRNDILNVMATGTASGQVVSITDGAENTPIKNLTIDFEPYQSGSGDPSPDNIRNFVGVTGIFEIIKSGKNLLGGLDLAQRIKYVIPSASINIDSKRVTYTAPAASDSVFISRTFFKPNTRYTFFFNFSKSSGYSMNTKIYYTDGTSDTFNFNHTPSSPETLVYVSDNNKTIDRIAGSNSGGTVYLYYENCGILEGVHTIDDFVPYIGERIAFNSPIEDTIYGGSIDATNGILIVKYGHIASYNGEELPSTWMSNMDVYVEGTTPTIGAEVVYRLAEPIVYQIDPIEFKTLLGENNFIFHKMYKEDVNIHLTYRKDISAVLTSLEERIAALENA